MNSEIILSGHDIYDDNTLLVVNKPAGLLSVPGRGTEKQDCLISRIQADFPRALVVHRLDQATSGLMIFALSREIQVVLGRLFEERQIHKEYEALLEGEIAPEGRLVLKQRLDPDNRPFQVIDEERGKEGITEWRCLELKVEGGKPVSRVRFYPRTGRTHQLRLLARELGAPILGDTLYGSCNRPEGLAKRMMLHSCRVEFVHPVSLKRIGFLSPVPF